ncbi:hypothetical protein [Ruegeria lacuscaerulensis]|uniref:hypothetical protein n=1 Tax=Ruegeria lacuscaerulensis TaxID=55218 RepID=UPI00147A54B7|nr:hypothetical protein [Ruegeria lacuscaerulensis]
MEVLGPDNAFWIDGEWISWDSIIDPDEVRYSRLAELEREAELRHRYPKADLTLVPYFHDLLALAQSYFNDTGQHLNVYGDIGELFGAIMYGIKLHNNHAKGSDGRMGDDFVEIKTIAPTNTKEQTSVRLDDRHFSTLLVVKIDADFNVSGRLIKRTNLPRRDSKNIRLSWDGLADLE